jgi:hypothetical protein
MGKYMNSQAGFTAVEGLLIALVLAVIGFGGYYVWHSQQPKKTTATTPATTNGQSAITKQTTTTDPYAGWKTGILKNEKISYHYPSNWTLVDSSADPNKTEVCVTPGPDNVTLTGPHGGNVSFQIGVPCRFNPDAQNIHSSTPINVLGQNAYLTLDGDTGPDSSQTYNACISQVSSPQRVSLNAKNVTKGSYSVKIVACYSPTSDATPQGTSVSGIEGSADFADAKLIFESMKY